MIFGGNAPLVGETRTRIVFAWLPIGLDDGRMAWLTHVRVRELGRLPHTFGSGYRPAREGERGYWSVEAVEAVL